MTRVNAKHCELISHESSGPHYSILSSSQGQDARTGILFYKQISITSNYRRSFIQKLLQELQNNVYFPGHAFLIHNGPKSLAVCQSQNGIRFSSVKAEPLFTICYRADVVLNAGDEREGAERGMTDSMVRVWEGVHLLIEKVMAKYALQNKLTYWLAWFRRQLDRVICQEEQRVPRLDISRVPSLDIFKDLESDSDDVSSDTQ